MGVGAPPAFQPGNTKPGGVFLYAGRSRPLPASQVARTSSGPPARFARSFLRRPAAARPGTGSRRRSGTLRREGPVSSAAWPLGRRGPGASQAASRIFCRATSRPVQRIPACGLSTRASVLRPGRTPSTGRSSFGQSPVMTQPRWQILTSPPRKLTNNAVPEFIRRPAKRRRCLRRMYVPMEGRVDQGLVSAVCLPNTVGLLRLPAKIMLRNDIHYYCA